MEWSLVVRAEKCDLSHMNYIKWIYYCFMFLLGKTNQYVLDQSTPCHVHSNPKKPGNLPVNALTMYNFIYPAAYVG